MDGDDVERRHRQTTLHRRRHLRRMMVVMWKDVAVLLSPPMIPAGLAGVLQESSGILQDCKPKS
jgi:hypothetical protein